jgi:hypothetical protein
MALGSIQTLTGMSAMDIFWWVKVAWACLTTLSPLCVDFYEICEPQLLETYQPAFTS